MEIATSLLEAGIVCGWNMFLLYGTGGLLAIIITALRAKFGYSDKIPMYASVVATIAALILIFLGVIQPMKRDVNENGIHVVDAVYEKRREKGNQGMFANGELFFTTETGERLSLHMVHYSNPDAFQPYLFENFPYSGPIKVRLYYAEHSNKALYMEVIEETQGYTQETGSSVS